ncbi:MAG TPA: alkaline phosphatase family protein [Marmoricola sp.]|nr:alkaline phosphatase family protein [Marmoricola sp.]
MSRLRLSGGRAMVAGLLAALLLPPMLLLAKGPLANAVDYDPGPRAQPLATQPCHGPASSPTHYQHVIWIWMENHSFHQVIGAPNAPFENGLAHACGLATHYRAITHPTLPNYLAATSGSTFGVHKDRTAPAQPINAPTIFSEVAASGRQWRTYYDSMPSNCHPMGRFGFARNPVMWFRGDRGLCSRWDLPMGTPHHGSLASALASNHLPAFSLMVPNLCHSTHSCPVANGDAWLSRWINRIVTSPAYRSGTTAVFLTWDEGKRDIGQHIPLIVIAPSTPPGTTTSTVFNHYSLLRTTADLLGLGSPGHAATAPSMRAAFGL